MKKVEIIGQLPGENPVFLATCSTIAEVKKVKDEYREVFPEIFLTTKIIKEEE